MRTIGILYITLSLMHPLLAQSPTERPIYIGGMGKFIGGLGVHGELPINNNFTLRGEAGWLFFILDVNAGVGYTLLPAIELYSAFHFTLMSFYTRSVAYGPELGIDFRITDVFHIEGGAIFLMNEEATQWVPNIGITLNIPLRP